MYKSKIAFRLFILGSLSLIIATLITSIPLSNLDHEINETRSNVDKHLSQTKSTLSMGIFYELKYLKIQMDYFQRNILIQTNAPQQAINHLEKRIEKDMSKLVEGWHTLNSGKEYNTTLSSVREDINKIMTNTSLSHKEKLDKLDLLLAEGVKKADSKQTEAEKQFDRNQDLLISLKQEAATWRFWFTITQVIGLILIFASQLLEKSTITHLKK
jgi:hypothetical protein